MNKKLTKISKILSYVLRHNPSSIDIELDSNGWVDVDELLQAMNNNGHAIDDDTLNEVVANNDKQRFSFSDGGIYIRANQGHSVDINLDLPTSTPPNQLYHGTADIFVDSIMKSGLLKHNRQHVHLSSNYETALSVGTRHGKPVILLINTKQMNDDGINFYLSDNGVWLTDFVDKKYIEIKNE